MKHVRIHLNQQRLLSLILLTLLVTLSLNVAGHGNIPNSAGWNTSESNAQAQFATLPLAFEPNQGQINGTASYLVHHGQATTYFDGTHTMTTVGGSTLTMSLNGANIPSFTGTNPLESKTNYFIGNNQSNWHSDIPNYKELFAKDVYPGIDLKFYGTNSQLEHDFIVSPGADYKQIAFQFSGQQAISIDDDGNLILKAGQNDLRLNAPTTYQQTTHEKHTLPSHFELNNNTVTIALNTDYDHSLPLVIDPTLIYATYLGGTDNDYAYNLTIDSTGNVYVLGQSDNTSNFPTAGSPFQSSNAGGSDAFVAKFNAAGTALVYSTYLGGTGIDWGDGGIAVDTSGNAYVSGNTDSIDFPTASPFQASNAGGGLDTFLAELDASGSSLIYSTYLGGSGTDFAVGRLALDSSNNVYVAGNTDSTDFPLAAAFQSSNAGGNDMYFAKFDSTGTSLIYSSYLGGSGNDYARNIALDPGADPFIVGYTDSSDYPTNAPFQASHAGGGNDAVVTKIDGSGSTLQYSTYLGGSGGDEGYGITIDLSGNAYVTGHTGSSDFPTANAYQSSYSGGNDAFIAKFDSAGASLTYSTYFGGGSSDYGRNIKVDTAGHAFISGITASTDFPILGAYQPANAGGFDLFLIKMTTSGSAPLYSTYLGGSGSEDTYGGIAVDSSGNAYMSGYSTSTDFPVLSSYQTTHGGSTYDAVIAKFTPESTVVVTGVSDPSLSFTLSSVLCDLGIFSATGTVSCTHTLTAATNATNGYVISYAPTTTLTSGANTITAMATQAASVVSTKQFGLNLKANTAAGSFTSNNFGADPSGGSGSVTSGYQTANMFKFNTSGDNIAQSTTASNPTAFTASYIANIDYVTTPGTYSTPVTYTIVASY